MDPITHGVLGATLAQSAARRNPTRAALLVGALAALAPDLDALIVSRTDPLLVLEYHRYFTHSLAFVPFGALLCAAALHWLVRRTLSFRATWLFAMVGVASHDVLDACTSYGTALLWPFSDLRISLSIVSGVDPAFTVPILALVVLAARLGRPQLASAAALWAVLYLGFGAIQHERALAAGAALAAERGHAPERVYAKPAFLSALLWRIVYEHDGRYHVDAVRVGLGKRTYAGTSTPTLDVARDFPWLDPMSRQAADVERFRRVADGLVAVDEEHPERVIDLRYSMVPNEIAGFWAIAVTPDRDREAHVDFVTTEDDAFRQGLRLLDMLL